MPEQLCALERMRVFVTGASGAPIAFVYGSRIGSGHATPLVRLLSNPHRHWQRVHVSGGGMRSVGLIDDHNN